MKNTCQSRTKAFWLAIVVLSLTQVVYGQTKFCRTEALNFCVEISNSNNNASFKVETSAEVGWVGVGVGEGMVGAYLMVAWPNSDGSVTISQRRTTDYVRPNPTDQQSDLTLSSSSGIRDGKFVVTFSRPLQVKGSIMSERVSDNSFVYAVSDQKVPQSDSRTETIQQHSFQGRISMSPSSNDKKMIAHGVIMFLAWAVCAPAAIFFAAFGRRILPRAWFHLHWSIQTFLTIPLVLAGFSLAYVARNKVFNAQVAHQLFGLILIIALGLQWTLGIIHHKLFDPKRQYVPWWTKLHWWWGRTVITAALVNIPLGLHRYNSLLSEIPRSLFIVYYVYIAIICLAYFVGSTFRRRPYRGLSTRESR